MEGRSENTATIKRFYFISLLSVTSFYFRAFPDQGRELWNDEACQSTWQAFVSVILCVQQYPILTLSQIFEMQRKISFVSHF